MSNTQTNVKVQQAREFRFGFREILNDAVNKGTVTVVERYSKPEGVLIPYEWLMNAHNGDFVQLVHQIRTAVQEAS